MHNLKIKKRFCSILFTLIIIIICLLNIYQYPSLIEPVSAYSKWRQTTDKDFAKGDSNDVEIFGINEDGCLRLDLKKDWLLQEPIYKPSARYNHASAPIWGTDRVLLFGGFDGLIRNDTWLYDVSNNTWTKQHLTYNPMGRIEHSIASIYGTDKVLLFGGWSNVGIMDDTWIYDFSDKQWVNVPSNYPGEHMGHSMSSIYGEEMVLLYGGFDYFGFPYTDETWIFDLGTNTWDEINCQNTPGELRNSAMAPIHGTDKVLLYGGEKWTKLDQINYTWTPMDEMWLFDLSDNNWTNITQMNNPGKRFDHAMTNIWNTKELILFGGNKSGKIMADTWNYNFKTNTWKNLTSSQIGPSSRTNFIISTVYDSYKLLLFGGFGDYSKRDTWIYKYYLDIKNGSYISPLFDTGTNSSFLTLNWRVKNTLNTSIKFQLRTSSVEQELFQKKFVGPDGNRLTYYTISPTSIWSGHTGDRWFQYRVYLNTTNKNETPLLEEILLYYNKYPIVKLLSPGNLQESSDNTPTFEWEMIDDSPFQDRFELIIDDDPNFTSIDFKIGPIETRSQEWTFPTGTSYSSIPDGIWYWSVRVSDSEGGISKFCEPFKFIIDTIPPRSVITTPITNASYTFVDQISGMVINVNNGTDVVKVRLQLERLLDGTFWNGNHWVKNQCWLLTMLITNWTYDPIAVDWELGKYYRVRSRAIDRVGNMEDPKNDIVFYIDNEEPWSKIDLVDNSWYKNLNKISGRAGDGLGAGIDNVQISIKNMGDGYYWTGNTWDFEPYWLNVKGTENWSFDTSNIKWKEGNKYLVRTKATDRLQNKEFPGNSVNFSLDSTSPRNSQIIIEQNNEFTTDLLVSLKLTAFDTISGLYQMSLKLNDGSWSNWTKYQSDYLYELPEIEGEYRIYFKVRDHAENEGEVVSDSIILDNQPPKIFGITFNNGSVETNSSKIVLRVNATDNTSGLSKIRFSTNGIYWSDWLNYSSRYDHILPLTDGWYKIYINIMDRAGNIAGPFNVSIFLNTTPQKEEKAESNHKPSKSEQEILSLFPLIWASLFITIMVILVAIFFNIRYKQKEKQLLKRDVLEKPAVIKRMKAPKKVEDGQLIVDRGKIK